MITATQKLIERDIRAKQEFRRGTVLTDAKRVNFDTSGVTSTVYVVDVDIGAKRPIRDVIVKSVSGNGGRAYAQVGKPVDIERNQGGRWFCIGASDRTRSVGKIQEFDETTETFSASIDDGFTFAIRPYDYWQQPGNVYGSPGWGANITVDADGNEVVD